MALTSAGKENDKSKKDKKKKKKDKDKHASVSLLGGAGRGAKMAANFYPELRTMYTAYNDISVKKSRSSGSQWNFNSKEIHKSPSRDERKPLRKGSGRGMSLDNHVEDGLLNKHRDHRIRRQQSQPERSACFNCLRNALHCYNIVVLILGVGALAVGVWLLVTDFSAREVTVLVDSDFFEIGTYLVLAGGGLIALLAFCGCCGTMREDRCILGFITSSIKLRLRESIQLHYGHDLRGNSYNRLVTDAWDSMQRKLECCGSDGNASAVYSWAIYKGHSEWYHNRRTSKIPYVPESCCKPDGDKALCVGSKPLKGPPAWGPPFQKNYKIIGIVIAFCLCARVTKSDNLDEEDL
ncbi:hypothetical protein KUTeg_016797 [Tegillarca granosa]|uniref:Tetraspanin n=1 Tax=Tegillarca granosa TaxID=220873 RepID=A0ABQ9ERR8_TEGGR|nr:hypothetical protein KUTeg_016797 [Tegillarca granosa]